MIISKEEATSQILIICKHVSQTYRQKQINLSVQKHFCYQLLQKTKIVLVTPKGLQSSQLLVISRSSETPLSASLSLKIHS